MTRFHRYRYSQYDFECECCGKLFTATRRDAKYCSARCRKRASRSGVEVWQKVFYCEHCGRQYHPSQPSQYNLYCSNACKQAAYRARKKQA